MYLKLFSYFPAIIVLMYLYIILLRFLGKTILFIYAEAKQLFLQKFKRIKPEKFRKTFGFLEYLSFVSENFFLSSKENRYYWIVFIAGNILMWQYFRYKDMTNTVFEHKKAREYYALSHHLLSYHMGLTVFFRNPGSVWLSPVNALQDSLINSVKEHLPKDDGEIAVYHYFFKLYPYVASHYYPDYDEAKEIVALTYQVLQEFSTMTIHDDEVKNDLRYKIYPMAAEYFIFIPWAEYKIDGQKLNRGYQEKVGTDLFKDPLKLQQLEDVGRWTITHYETLKKFPSAKSFVYDDPLIESMYLASIVASLRDVIGSKIFHLTFQCEDELVPMVFKYISIYDKKYYSRPDKRLWKYRNVIALQSMSFSNVTCSLCGYEPIRGTYVHRSSACFPKENDASYTKKFWDSDSSTHFKWLYRVRELEKTINKNKKVGGEPNTSL